MPYNDPEVERKYKQEYYKKNIDKYNKRNMKASRERSILLKADKASEEELCHMIEQLSTDDIIYKMNYILNNSIVKIDEKIYKTKKPIIVTL
jgi:hypothetical protein